LRWQREQSRGGSSPLDRTTKFLNPCATRPNFIILLSLQALTIAIYIASASPFREWSVYCIDEDWRK
jgi:hypothetical protein